MPACVSRIISASRTSGRTSATPRTSGPSVAIASSRQCRSSTYAFGCTTTARVRPSEACTSRYALAGACGGATGQAGDAG